MKKFICSYDHNGICKKRSGAMTSYGYDVVYCGEYDGEKPYKECEKRLEKKAENKKEKNND